MARCRAARIPVELFQQCHAGKNKNPMDGAISCFRIKGLADQCEREWWIRSYIAINENRFTYPNRFSEKNRIEIGFRSETVNSFPI